MSAQSGVLSRSRLRLDSLLIPISYLLIGIVALAVRLRYLGGFVTLDEINFWLRRSETFLTALGSGNYTATALASHPGVTTMWLGSAGIILRRGLLAAGLLADESFATRLALFRLPVVLAHVLGLLLGYRLLRRLLPPTAAATAAFLWAVDPFIIGYSQLLHVDALAGTFMTLSLLSACLYWYHGSSRSMLILSALCASLAILSKTPALILLPLVGLIAFTAGAEHKEQRTKNKGAGTAEPQNRRTEAENKEQRTKNKGARAENREPRTENQEPRTEHSLWPNPLNPFSKSADSEPRTDDRAQKDALGDPRSSILDPRSSILDPRSSILDPRSSILDPRSSVVSLLLWGVLALLGIVALWPALWVSPLYALDQMRLGVEAEGAEPHMLGNFFLGQSIDAPGPLFYPVALALHLFPWTMLGLAPLLWLWRSTPPRTRRTLAALLAFVVLFIVAMSVFPKKFDRYLVPVFPAIDILAAYGLVRGATSISQMTRGFGDRIGLRPRHLLQGQLLAVGGAALLTTVGLGNYSITSFNPLLGGLSTGSNTFLVGWGEGLDQAAAWLNQQPDITGVVTVSTSTRPLQPYLRPGAQSVTPSGSDLPEHAGYVVIYIRDVMRGAPGPPFDRYFRREEPLFVARIAGVEYVWIYQVAPPVATPRPADFGSDIHLHGFEQIDELRPGAPTMFKLFWETRQAPTIDYTLFAHLIGPDGQRYGQTDLPYPTSGWGERRYHTSDLPIELPANAPPGPYRLVIGLYDPASQQRLPLAAPEPVNEALDGPHALVLTQIDDR